MGDQGTNRPFTELKLKRKKRFKLTVLFLLSCLLGLVLAIAGSDDKNYYQNAARYWGERIPPPSEVIAFWGDVFTPSSRPPAEPEIASRPAESELEAPTAKESQSEVIEDHPSRPVAKNASASTKLSDLDQAYQVLNVRVDQLLARRAFAEASSSLSAFESSHRGKVTGKKISEVRTRIENARAAYRAERLGAEEKRFEQTGVQVKTLMGEDRFEEAKDLYGPFTSSEFEEIRSKGRKALAELDQRYAVYAKETLPARRKLYPQILLELATEIDRRDYLQARKKVSERMMGDGPYQLLTPILIEDLRMLGQCAELIVLARKNLSKLPMQQQTTFRQKNGMTLQGMFVKFDQDRIEMLAGGGTAFIDFNHLAPSEIIKYTPEAPQNLSPLIHAWFLLYEGETAAALEAAQQVYTGQGDDREIYRFFERLALVTGVVDSQKLSLGLARAEDLKARQKWADLNKLLISLTGQYKDSPAYAEVKSRIDALSKSADEETLKAAVPTYAVAHVKILSNPSSSIEEKVAALKGLASVSEKEVLPYIAHALKDESSRVRMTACEILSKNADPSILWDLVKAMDDPVIEVGTMASLALTKQDKEPLLALLRQKISSKDENDRRLAALGFSTIAEEEAASTLLNAARDESWRVRKTAVVALIRIDAKQTASSLLSRLGQEKHNEVRIALAMALGYFKYASAAPAILKIVKAEPHNPYRKQYLKALGETGNKNIDDGLKEVLKDPDPWIRYTALQAMVDAGATPDPKNVEPLLKDDNWTARAAAVTLLGRFGDPKIVKTMMEALADNNDVVSYSATQALVTWPDAHVITEMIRNLDKVSETAYAKTLGVLQHLTKQSFNGGDKKQVQQEWANWWSKNAHKFKMPRENQ